MEDIYRAEELKKLFDIAQEIRDAKAREKTYVERKSHPSVENNDKEQLNLCAKNPLENIAEQSKRDEDNRRKIKKIVQEDFDQARARRLDT